MIEDRISRFLTEKPHKWAELDLDPRNSNVEDERIVSYKLSECCATCAHSNFHESFTCTNTELFKKYRQAGPDYDIIAVKSWGVCIFYDKGSPHNWPDE